MIDCKGLCQNSCGPLPLGKTEERRLVEERSGRKLQTASRGLCSMLSPNGRCTVYSDRPTICRLWGVVESMRCPHGCKPERVLSDPEGFALLAEAEEGRFGDGEATREAMKNMTPDERLAMFRFINEGAPDLRPKSIFYR